MDITPHASRPSDAARSLGTPVPRISPSPGKTRHISSLVEVLSTSCSIGWRNGCVKADILAYVGPFLTPRRGHAGCLGSHTSSDFGLNVGKAVWAGPVDTYQVFL